MVMINKFDKSHHYVPGDIVSLPPTQENPYGQTAQIGSDGNLVDIPSAQNDPYGHSPFNDPAMQAGGSFNKGRFYGPTREATTTTTADHYIIDVSKNTMDKINMLMEVTEAETISELINKLVEAEANAISGDPFVEKIYRKSKRKKSSKYVYEKLYDEEDKEADRDIVPF